MSTKIDYKENEERKKKLSLIAFIMSVGLATTRLWLVFLWPFF